REAIRAQLMVEKYRERRQDIDSYIRQHLLKNIKFEAPKNEIERLHKELVGREKLNLHYRGVSEEDLDKYSKELEDKMKPLAEEEVKLYYIFEAIAKQEGLKASNNLNEAVVGLILSFADFKK
ncbi:MAG: hypothetical protein JW867_08540, partial [Candidatus Omnitrophica bacterium]|nr:hypothetical protein [Candidatus Omnitrophota bacterium]